MSSIDIKELSFSYRNTPIFKDLDLSIPGSEVCILMGANGSGKTTFCRILSGLENTYSGSIEKDIELRFLQQFAESNLLAATPLFDLAVWKKNFSADIEEKEINIFRKCLKWFNMEDFAEQPVWELSGGQQQRVALSALLLNQSHFWLLDEPAAGLDKLQQDNLIKLIEDHREKGYGALIVTHRISLFKSIADNIYEIKDHTIERI